MESIYIISTVNFAKDNMYKPGRHTGTVEGLYTRYQTALINPIIYYFRETSNAVRIENEIKRKLYEYRIANDSGRKIEWVTLDLESIINVIQNVFENYKEKSTPAYSVQISVIKSNNKNATPKNNATTNNSTMNKLLDELYDNTVVSYTDIAKIFFHMYPNLFIYDTTTTTESNKNGIWLTYDKSGKYHICNEMLKANLLLNENIYDTIKYNYLNRLHNLISNTVYNKTVKQNKIATLKKNGEAILSKIKNTTSIQHILESLKEFYHKENIFENLDEINPHLIGFNNGVYDLQKRIFRKSEPSELMYASTGFDYAEPNRKYIDKIKKIINDIYPDKSERNYIMTILSFCLSGISYLNQFYLMTGSSNSGKDILVLLISMTMGTTYCASIDMEYLKDNNTLSKQDKSQQLISYKKARLIFVKKCTMKTNEEFESLLVKKLSGGDKESYDFLDKKQKFNLYFIINDSTQMKTADDILINRTRICPHQVSFVNEQEYNKKNRYMVLEKNGLKEKLLNDLEYKHAFFSILLKYHFKFLDNGKKLKIPESLSKINSDFKHSNAPLSNFIDDCFVITHKSVDKIKLTDFNRILKRYDSSIHENDKNITQYLNKKNVGTSAIRENLTCTGIKFKDVSRLNKTLSKDFVKWLIREEYINDEKSENSSNKTSESNNGEEEISNSKSSKSIDNEMFDSDSEDDVDNSEDVFDNDASESSDGECDSSDTSDSSDSGDETSNSEDISHKDTKKKVTRKKTTEKKVIEKKVTEKKVTKKKTTKKKATKKKANKKKVTNKNAVLTDLKKDMKNTKLQPKKKILDVLDIDTIDENDLMEIIKNEDKFIRCVRSMLLYHTKDEIQNISIKEYVKKFSFVQKPTRLFRVLTVIEWLEKELGVNRFKITDMKIKNINNLVEKMLKKIDMFQYLNYKNTEDRRKKEIENRIKKLISEDRVKRFFMGAVNQFDTFYNFVSKQVGSDKTIYFNFSFNADLVTYHAKIIRYMKTPSSKFNDPMKSILMKKNI